MIKINIQEKTKVCTGKIQSFTYENSNIGLKPTLFHRITLPLIPFESGLEYISQPEETSIVFDWYNLNLLDKNQLDGLNLTSINYPDSEVSVYVGGAHNWCDVKKCKIRVKEENVFLMDCSLLIEFKNEGIAENENFEFNAEIIFQTE